MAAEEHYRHGKLLSAVYVNQNGKRVASIEHGDGTRVVERSNGIDEYQTYVDGIQQGLITTYHEDGMIAKTHSTKNNHKHGVETIYYHQRADQHQPIRKVSVHWHRGKIQGITRTWYRDGSPESQREMSDNDRHGVSTVWYPDGSLMMIEEYDHGILTKGQYMTQGQRSPVSRVEKGEGVATLFDAEGMFLRRITYEQGQPVL